MIVFGILIVGVVIARFSIRKSGKRPKGGRVFKRKMD
jgi:hypothetical protein